MSLKATMIPLGLESQEQRLNAHLAKIKGATRQGLIEGGLIILGAAQDNCPVLTGNLKASGDIVIDERSKPPPAWVPPEGKALTAPQQLALDTGWKEFMDESHREIKASGPRFAICVGFGAFYAIFVHELHRTAGKFLQKAISVNLVRVLRRVEQRARSAGGGTSAP